MSGCIENFWIACEKSKDVAPSYFNGVKHISYHVSNISDSNMVQEMTALLDDVEMPSLINGIITQCSSGNTLVVFIKNPLPVQQVSHKWAI